jgi:hypothetical protein
MPLRVKERKEIGVDIEGLFRDIDSAYGFTLEEKILCLTELSGARFLVWVNQSGSWKT